MTSSDAATPLLGCIADDYTGATDLCSVLVGEGLPTVQTIGVPDDDADLPLADALVVALKIRTAPVDEAVHAARTALRWLRERGARQFFFKYCSTFDSTAAGNIGPVADALMDDLGASTTIVCPALPENGRTVYQGHLFVADRLLSESSMADHPLTPMHDPDLVRHLGHQTRAAVDLIDYATVRSGASVIKTAIGQCRQAGVRYAVVDALDDEQLRAVGAACAELPLVTGGSGVARGLPDNYRRAGLVQERTVGQRFPQLTGPAAILAGSSSAATREQVRRHREHSPAFELDPLTLARDPAALGELSRRACDALGGDPVLVYASAPPSRVREVHAELGAERAAKLIEAAMGQLAVDLVTRGARRVVVAGGETSGAVVQALGISALQIGPNIAPGVPWTLAIRQGEALGMVLKSGNFGGADFFREAVEVQS